MSETALRPPPGPATAWSSRRALARAWNWPDGALQACQDIEHRHPGLTAWYGHDGMRGGPPGFHAWQYRGRPWEHLYGATAEELEQKIRRATEDGHFRSSLR
jgi:hypothetical protein